MDELQLDLLASGPLEGLGEAALLLLVKHDGAADLGDLALALGRRPLDEAVDDLGQLAGSPGADDEGDDVDREGGRLLTEQVLDDRLAFLDGQCLVGELLAQLLVALEELRELEQLVLDRLEGPLGLGDLDDRLRVPVDAIGHYRELPTWLM